MHDGRTIRIHLHDSEARQEHHLPNPDAWRDYTWISYHPTQDIPLAAQTMHRVVELYVDLAGERAHLQSEWDKWHNTLSLLLDKQQLGRASEYVRRLRWLVLYLAQPRATRFTTLSPGERPEIAPALTRALARMSTRQHSLQQTLDVLHHAALSSESDSGEPAQDAQDTYWQHATGIERKE